MKVKVDEMASRQKKKLMKEQVDERASWWNTNLMKQQIDKMLNGYFKNGKLTKWHIAELMKQPST